MPKNVVSKIDPKSFLQPQADVAWTPPGMAPIVAAPPKDPPPPEEKQPRQKMDVSHLDIPKVEDPYKKAIPDDLVTQLCEELGLLPPSELRKISIQVGSKTIDLEVRAPNWADQTWMWGEWPHIRQEYPDLTETRYQIDDVTDALILCRTVVKINNKYVWDRLNYRALISSEVVGWDGEDHQRVPSTFISQMALNVFRSFVKMDLRILSALAASRQEVKTEEENPTKAT